MFKEVDKDIIEKLKDYKKADICDGMPKYNDMDPANEVIYKNAFTSISIDVINFKKMSEYTNKKIFVSIMNEFMNGAIEIMSSNPKPFRIEIQGDGAYAIYDMKNSKIDYIFNKIRELNNFQQRLQTSVDFVFGDKIKIDKYNYEKNYFKFGIGASFSEDNYMAFVGTKKYKDTIFMGHSLNCASNLAKLASRNDYEGVLIDDGFYEKMSASKDKGFKAYIKEQQFFDVVLPYNEKVYGLGLIVENYYKK